jgi:uncharacterized protein
LIDVPAILISAMLIGLLFAIAETLRALSVGELFAPRLPRRTLVFDPFVLAAAIILFVGVALVSALVTVPSAEGSSEQSFARALHAQALGNLVVVALLIPLLRVTRKNRLVDYGVTWRGWLDELHYGVIGYVASLPPVIVVLLLMTPWRSPETEHPFLKLMSQTHSDRLLVEVTLAASVIAPLMEELVFRVVLQGLLETVARPAVAVLIPAILFASVHGPDAVPLLPLAIVLGVVYHIRHSYVAVVTIHALFNMTFLILTLKARLPM